MQRAQADADKLLKSARGAAEQERNAMLEGAKKDIAQMVVSATGKLMDKENDPAFDKALYDSFLKAAQEENDHD
jgi:F-type H+-transporting ATPase subunit b